MTLYLHYNDFRRANVSRPVCSLFRTLFGDRVEISEYTTDLTQVGSLWDGIATTVLPEPELAHYRLLRSRIGVQFLQVYDLYKAPWRAAGDMDYTSLPQGCRDSVDAFHRAVTRLFVRCYQDAFACPAPAHPMGDIVIALKLPGHHVNTGQ